LLGDYSAGKTKNPEGRDSSGAVGVGLGVKAKGSDQFASTEPERPGRRSVSRSDSAVICMKVMLGGRGGNASRKATPVWVLWARVLGRNNLKMGKDVAITNFTIEHLLEYR
jgi:hypothetical protein